MSKVNSEFKVHEMGAITEEEFSYTKIWNFIKRKILNEGVNDDRLLAIPIGTPKSWLSGEYYLQSEDEKYVVHCGILHDVAVFYFDAGEPSEDLAYELFRMIKKLKRRKKNEID